MREMWGKCGKKWENVENVGKCGKSGEKWGKLGEKAENVEKSCSVGSLLRLDLESPEASNKVSVATEAWWVRRL